MHFACAKSNSTVKNRIFRDFGVAEAPPGFQAGWSDCMYFVKSRYDFHIISKAEELTP
jgi:hypothetical protein